jgi:uncharacterized damage-inducible protein DinB
MEGQLSIETFRFFERYQRWAMERVLRTANALGDSGTQAVVVGSNGGGTLPGLLGHIVDADIHWLNRWLGNERSEMQMPGAWTTITEIAAAWREDLPRRDTFFDGLNEPVLLGEFDFYRGNPPARDRRILWQTILHVQNHATHHRAEICALLTSIGAAPESVDMIDYIRQL